MTRREQDLHHERCMAVRHALSVLRLSGVTHEDVAVAKARLENWLTENDGRWAR